MKKMILGVLFSIFLVVLMAVPSMSQVTVGVSVGDTFEWVGTYSHETNDTGSMIPGQVSPYEFWNNVTSMTATISDVSGTNVTFDKVWHYSNGTDVPETEVQNITNTATAYICNAPNLEVGDEFTQYDSFSYGPLNISDTVMWDYADETRETNHHVSVTGLFAVVTRQYWFDKETGICVQANLRAVLEGTSITEYTLELVDTSLWVIPEFPTSSVMLFVFVAATVCIDLYRRKKIRF